MFKRIVIRANQRGLRFVNEALAEVLKPGVHWRFGARQRVEVVSTEALFLAHDRLEHIVDSGLLRDELEVLDLAESERAFVWKDGRLVAALRPGLFALWKVSRPLEVESFQVDPVRLIHPRLALVADKAIAEPLLEFVRVPAQHAGVLEVDGQMVEDLGP